VSTAIPERARPGRRQPALIDNSPEREFEDIQPGRPDERREVEAEEDQARRPSPGEREDDRA
jgi:hypothetical protein